MLVSSGVIFQGQAHYVEIIKKKFHMKRSDIQGSLDYSIRAQSQKNIRWISPADNHDLCQDEGCQEIISKHMLCE
jgi:hypothetical protein